MTDSKGRAADRPIDGRCPDLALEIRRLMGWEPSGDRPYLTSRVAARRTGVSHTTIANMLRGDRPTADVLILFAKGMGADYRKLLRLAGLPLADLSHDPILEEIEVARFQGEFGEKDEADILEYVRKKREQARRRKQ